ncbi:hypothetical protein Tco_1275994 [Tanacetum coccineum]
MRRCYSMYGLNGPKHMTFSLDIRILTDSFISDESVNLKPSVVTDIYAVKDDAFIVDKKYVNVIDLSLASHEKDLISNRDYLEKKDFYGSEAKSSDDVDYVVRNKFNVSHEDVGSKNVDVNDDEDVAYEDVDLTGNNVFDAEQKSFLGDEDVEFAQNNYVVFHSSDDKRDESSDADMNICSDTPKFTSDADADTNGIDDVPAVDKVVSNGNNALVLWESGKIAFNGIHAKSIVDVAGNKDVDGSEHKANDVDSVVKNKLCVSGEDVHLTVKKVDDNDDDVNVVVSDEKLFNGDDDVEIAPQIYVLSDDMMLDYDEVVESAPYKSRGLEYDIEPSFEEIQSTILNVGYRKVAKPLETTLFSLTWRLLMAYINYGQIIFNDLAAKLSNYVRHPSPAYSRFISLILEKALGDNYVVSDGSALNIPVIESCLVSQDVEGLDMCDIVYDGSSSVEPNDSEMIQMVNTKTMSGLLDPNSTETSDVYPFKVPTNRLSEDVIGESAIPSGSGDHNLEDDCPGNTDEISNCLNQDVIHSSAIPSVSPGQSFENLIHVDDDIMNVDCDDESENKGNHFALEDVVQSYPNHSKFSGLIEQVHLLTNQVSTLVNEQQIRLITCTKFQHHQRNHLSLKLSNVLHHLCLQFQLI